MIRQLQNANSSSPSQQGTEPPASISQSFWPPLLRDITILGVQCRSNTQAWDSGVQIAAFELGKLYEHGVAASDLAGNILLAPDPAKAWLWYQKGADAGEPNSLARFAERDEAKALADASQQSSDTLLLQAFKFYAASAERARDEGWPDDAWSNWRYRRASLARILAREGMMQQVADAYRVIREK